MPLWNERVFRFERALVFVYCSLKEERRLSLFQVELPRLQGDAFFSGTRRIFPDKLGLALVTVVFSSAATSLRLIKNLMQISIPARQNLRLLRALLTLAAIHGNPVAFEIVTVHFINHRCQANENQCMWRQGLEAQLDSSKVWLCKKACQGLKISPEAWCIHSTQKINDMSYNQLTSDVSTYVKKSAQRRFDPLASRG